MRFRIVAGIALLTCASASPARAGWSVPGDTVYSYYGGGGGPMSVVPDGSGGHLVTLTLNQQAALQTRIFHIAADGTPLPAFNIPFETTLWTLDGAGGAFQGQAYQSDLYLGHEFADGTRDPHFDGLKFWDHTSGLGSANGVGIARDDSGGVYVASVVSDPASGTRFVAWRLLPDASPAGGWPVDGVTIRELINESAFHPPIACADGSGGAVVVMPVMTNSTGTFSLRSYRYRANGTRAWFSLATSAHPGDLTQLGLFPAGDHIFYAWSTPVTPTVTQIWLQSLNVSNGQPAAGWPASGLLVASGHPDTLRQEIASDGGDGIYVAWTQNALRRAVRVTAAGTLAPGWPSDGLVLVPDVAGYARKVATIAPSSSGLIVFFGDATAGPHGGTRVRWLLPDGTPDPAVPDTGLVDIHPVNGGPLGAGSDGNGGALLCWVDVIWFTTSQFNPFIVTPVPRPAGVASVPDAARTMRMRAWPNPATNAIRVSFTLADVAPARIELLDVGGRVQRVVDVAGTGERSARFEHLESLPAGVYFVRVAHGRAVQLARVALVH